jgi:vitamin B12 transporter
VGNILTSLQSCGPFVVNKKGNLYVHIFKTVLLTATIMSPFVIATRAHAEETDQPQIVVTASGIEQVKAETGQSITIVDRDRLQTLQTATIADALKTLPSVSVAQRGSVGSQTSVFIRGGNSSQTLVLLDGVRINDPSSPNGLYDFGALLSSNIGQVELLRGPNSIIWGSQAIGGVVNVTTLKPTKAFSANVSAEYGYADTRVLDANIAGTSGIFEGSVGGGYYRSDGISSLAGGTERDGYERLGANGRLKINLLDNFAFDLRGYYSDGKVAYDSPFGVGANGLPVTDNSQFTGYVGANLNLFDGVLRNRIAYTRSDITRIGTDPVVFSFNNFDVKGKVDRFEYQGVFDLAKAATFVFGLEHERTFSSTSFEGAPADIAKTNVSSAYLQMIARPVAGLTLTGGVRHDDYNVYGGQTTLGGNIAYTPNEGRTVFRATYGEGFRAPTLTEGQPPFGNPNLKPETARNFDLGVEHGFLGGKAQVYATYFNRKSNDLINFSFVSFQSENIERVRVTGLETGFILRPAQNLDIRAGYSLINAINKSAPNFDKRLALRPQDSANVTIDWQSPWKVKLGTSLQIIGDSFDNASNTVRLDGHALVGVRAAYPVNDILEIYGRVDNAFNSRYETVAGYNTYGRSAYAGVRARF